MGTRTEIAADAAMEFFKGQAISVQTAEKKSVKGDDGVTREAFKTSNVPLREAHILSAADYGDRVAIVTIDGRRYEAARKAK